MNMIQIVNMNQYLKYLIKRNFWPFSTYVWINKLQRDALLQ